MIIKNIYDSAVPISYPEDEGSLFPSGYTTPLSTGPQLNTYHHGEVKYWTAILFIFRSLAECKTSINSNL